MRNQERELYEQLLKRQHRRLYLALHIILTGMAFAALWLLMGNFILYSRWTFVFVMFGGLLILLHMVYLFVRERFLEGNLADRLRRVQWGEPAAPVEKVKHDSYMRLSDDGELEPFYDEAEEPRQRYG